MPWIHQDRMKHCGMCKTRPEVLPNSLFGAVFFFFVSEFWGIQNGSLYVRFVEVWGNIIRFTRG